MFLEIQRAVGLARDAEVFTICPTWSEGSFGIGDADNIHAKIRDMVDIQMAKWGVVC